MLNLVLKQQKQNVKSNEKSIRSISAAKLNKCPT